MFPIDRREMQRLGTISNDNLRFSTDAFSQVFARQYIEDKIRVVSTPTPEIRISGIISPREARDVLSHKNLVS